MTATRDPRREPWVAGADGCRGGWVVARCPAGAMARAEVCVVPDLAAILRLRPAARIVALDMPIGLLDAARPGGRPCDPPARRRLGPRASSVFTPPVRQALAAAGDYRAALAVNRASSDANLGIGIQCFNLFPKLAEVDAAMTPARQRRVKEAHPELAFAALDGGRPLAAPKRTPAGRHARERLLERAGMVGLDALFGGLRGTGAARDDLYDACALLWTAERILGRRATRLPARPSRDSRGLLMEIWF